VVTKNADPQHAKAEHESIRQNIMALFGSFQYQSTATFLDSGYSVSFSRDIDLGDSEQGDVSPFFVHSTNKMRLTVFYPSPLVE
jgi:hypothetical protein